MISLRAIVFLHLAVLAAAVVVLLCSVYVFSIYAEETPRIAWISQFGSSSEDHVQGISPDSTGIYVAGYTSGTLPGQSSAGGVDAFVRKYDANGSEVWTRQFGTSSQDCAFGVSIDSTGIYVCGGVVGTFPGQISAGEWGDAFVRKYDASGNELWTRQFGSATSDDAYGIVVNSTGTYVLGYTEGALPSQTSAGGGDVFIRKYDASGNELWTRQFGSDSPDYAGAICADSTGIYVSGYTLGALADQSNSGITDAFVRKYDTSGNELWTRQFGTDSGDSVSGISADATGIYICGQTEGTLPGQTKVGVYDAFVRKYDTSGNELWTRQFGTGFYDYTSGISADATGIYVGGSTGGTFPGQTSAGGYDAFVRKYNTSGSELWTFQFGSALQDTPLAISANSSSVYLGGLTEGALPDQSSVGGRDAFVVKLTSTATPTVTATSTPTPTPLPMPTPTITPKPTTSGLAYITWPMFGRDAQHTGRSPYNGPAAAQTIWIYNAGGDAGGLAIGAGDTLYAGASDGKLYAVDAYGHLKWSYQVTKIPSNMFTTLFAPAVGPDATIYVGSALGVGGDKLYALYPDGTLKWSYSAGGGIGGTPTIDASGTVYFGAIDGKIYALNPDGSMKWSFNTGSPIGSPAIGTDETIYIGTRDSPQGKLYAINPDGTLKWSYNTGTSCACTSPAIGPDGSVYIGPASNKLYAISPDGYLKWSYELPGQAGAPAIANDGTIYIGSWGSSLLYALDSEGSLKWTFKAGSWIVAQPAIGSDGTIYAGSGDGNLYSLTPDGALKWSYNVGGMIQSSPVIGRYGAIYVGPYGGGYKKLYAIGLNVAQVGLILDDASSSVTEERSKGFSSAAAEKLATDAGQAFEAGDYQTALAFAIQAKNLATDIDQDGVPNEGDFAPTIKNIYIYAGGSAFTFVLIVLPSSILTFRWRRKRAEKELIKKQKSEIIDMIDKGLR